MIILVNLIVVWVCKIEKWRVEIKIWKILSNRRHRNIKKGDFIGEHLWGIWDTRRGWIWHSLSGLCAQSWIRYCFEDISRWIHDGHKTREQFKKEASVWVDLEFHPYIVGAIMWRNKWPLYIGLEYIPPDENGLNTLDGYLRVKPPDLLQSLRWAIQFCYGMEYIYSKGVRCTGNISRRNIMIDNEKK